MNETPDYSTMHDHDALLDDDDGYREWSETIEKETQEQQDADADYIAALEQEQAEINEQPDLKVIDLSRHTWPEVLTKLLPTAGQK